MSRVFDEALAHLNAAVDDICGYPPREDDPPNVTVIRATADGIWIDGVLVDDEPEG